MKDLKHIKRFNESDEMKSSLRSKGLMNESDENLNISDVSNSIKINEGDEFGVVNIQIDGQGFIKSKIVNDIRQLLSKYQGERHLFVDGEEVNPYRSSGGMG